ncbi:hypothetical protein ACWGNF_31420 [Streptomyces sp. NPDC055808]
MTSLPDPLLAPPYAVDITRADVDALDTFMTTWLHELRLAHRYDPAICKVTYGLATAVNRLLFDLRRTFEVNDGSPELLHTRMRHWNELCRVTAGWRETEGYDATRWQQVTFLDAQDAAASKPRSEQESEMEPEVAPDERALRAHP